MGILASVVGLFAGLALAKGLFSLFDAVGFTLPNNGLTLETRTIVVALVVGIVVTLLASLGLPCEPPVCRRSRRCGREQRCRSPASRNTGSLLRPC